MIPGGARQRGFVLALTLWVLAIVTIVAAYFAERVHRTLELAQSSKQNVETMVAMNDTRAEILYRLATTHVSVYGLGNTQADSIALDDRPYRGQGGTIIRLQDDRGLLNLNIVDDARLSRFLTTLGVPGDQLNSLTDKLRDYTDSDNLKRLNGAEESEYRAANLPPPRNEQLITPFEAKKIIGWKDQARLWKNDELQRLTTTSYAVAMNPNTAPWQVLATMPGVTYDVARAMIEKRKLAPFTNPVQFIPLIPMPIDQLVPQINLLPASSIRVTQSAPGVPWALQYNVSLTPNTKLAPWRVDYSYKVELPYADDKKEVVAILPPRVTVSGSTSPF